MRHLTVTAALAAALPLGCSAADRDSEPPVVEVVDHRAQAQREAAARYEEELARAPSYRSDIRDLLVADPDRFEDGYRPLLDDFRGLDRQFRCIHSPLALSRAQADGWQLVKCSASSAVFFRRHGQDRVCRGRRSIPDEFETLTLQFARDPAALGEPQRTPTQVLYGVILGGFERVAVDQLKGDLGLPARENMVFGRSSTSETDIDVVLDLDREMAMTFHHRKAAASCMRNAHGWLLSGQRIVTLDSPIAGYGRMAEALQTAGAYLDGLR